MRSFVLAPLLVVAALAATTGTAVAATPAPSPAPAAAAPGGVGLRLLDVPTDAARDPRAQVYIVDHLQPGAMIQRRVEVSNTTSAPVHVSLYAAAATIADGAFTGRDGRAQNDLSSWTRLGKAELDLAPGAKVPDVVTVAVPADAAPGEQYAAVWAEISNHAAGINLVNRVGMRMYVSVGGGNAPATSFALDSLTAVRGADGRPAVTARVRNDGGRALDMSGQLTLSDGPGSMTAGPFPAQLGSTLAPGQSVPVVVPLNAQLPDGPWQVSMTLRSGLVEKSAEARVVFPSGPGASAPVSPDAVPAGVPVPLLIGVLLVLVVLAAGAGVLLGRRRAGRSS